MMWLAKGAMYESYYIRTSDFMMEEEVGHLTSDFMCSVQAGKRGYKAFRINWETGTCEMGNLAKVTIQQVATQSTQGYVTSIFLLFTCGTSQQVNES